MINRRLQLTKQQIPDELLRYLIWHELCHFILYAHAHDSEFRRLESLWPDSVNLDYQLDTLHERIDFKEIKRSAH